MGIFRILPLLLTFSTLAQVNLFIEDKTGEKFLLGINGFVQNEEAASTILIQKLDTFPTSVRIEQANGNFFSKTIHLHQKGNYHYIVTKNSEGKVQMRYRGKMKELPKEGTQLLVQTSAPLPILASAAPPTTIAAAQPIIETPIPIVKDSIKVDSIVETAHANATVNDTNVIAPFDTIEVIDQDPFNLFFESLTAQEFEFEKLESAKTYTRNHTLDKEEVKSILSTMKYDNTKLAYINAEISKLKTIDGISELKESFEYEISKQQFEKLLEQ